MNYNNQDLGYSDFNKSDPSEITEGDSRDVYGNSFYTPFNQHKETDFQVSPIFFPPPKVIDRQIPNLNNHDFYSPKQQEPFHYDQADVPLTNQEWAENDVSTNRDDLAEIFSLMLKDNDLPEDELDLDQIITHEEDQQLEEESLKKENDEHRQPSSPEKLVMTYSDPSFDKLVQDFTNLLQKDSEQTIIDEDVEDIEVLVDEVEEIHVEEVIALDDKQKEMLDTEEIFVDENDLHSLHESNAEQQELPASPLADDLNFDAVLDTEEVELSEQDLLDDAGDMDDDMKTILHQLSSKLDHFEHQLLKLEQDQTELDKDHFVRPSYDETKEIVMVKLPVLLSKLNVTIDFQDCIDLEHPVSHIQDTTWSVQSLTAHAIIPAKKVFLKGILLAHVVYVHEEKKRTHLMKIPIYWEKVVPVEWLRNPITGKSRKREYTFMVDGSPNDHYEFSNSFTEDIQEEINHIHLVWHDEPLIKKNENQQLLIQGSANMLIHLVQNQYVPIEIPIK